MTTMRRRRRRRSAIESARGQKGLWFRERVCVCGWVLGVCCRMCMLVVLIGRASERCACVAYVRLLFNCFDTRSVVPLFHSLYSLLFLHCFCSCRG